MIKQALEGIRQLLAIVASWTPTTVDDQVIAFIDAILKSPEILEWLESLFSGLTAAQTLGNAPKAQLEAAAQAANIDWQSLITLILPYLLKLLQAWLASQGNGGGLGGLLPRTNYEPATTNRCG